MERQNGSRNLKRTLSLVSYEEYYGEYYQMKRIREERAMDRIKSTCIDCHCELPIGQNLCVACATSVTCISCHRRLRLDRFKEADKECEACSRKKEKVQIGGGVFNLVFSHRKLEGETALLDEYLEERFQQISDILRQEYDRRRLVKSNLNVYYT